MALALTGCASGGGSGPSAAPTVTSVVQPQQFKTPSSSYDMTTVETREVVIATILAPADSVWPVVRSVFLELGVEPATVNNQERYIANTSFRLQRQLGGVQISHYLDCGMGALGPVAQQSQITMSLSIQVMNDSAEVSRIKTQVNGYAVPEGVASNRTHCATTGQLESRIARMVTDALAHRAKK